MIYTLAEDLARYPTASTRDLSLEGRTAAIHDMLTDLWQLAQKDGQLANLSAALALEILEEFPAILARARASALTASTN